MNRTRVWYPKLPSGEYKPLMPNKRALIPVVLGTICLLESGAALPACDNIGRPEVFGIGNKWEVPDESLLGRADFSKACDALIGCYSTAGSSKTTCDRIYASDLKSACKKPFEYKAKALGLCLETVNTAIEFVKQGDGSTYRKMQRTAQATKREEERKARADARRARAEERRKQRRDLRLKE